MKAAVIDTYGPAGVFKIRDIPCPNVGQDQVLIRIHSSSVNPIDWKIRNGSMRFRFGWKFPMLLGFDFSGEIAAVGADVHAFSVGDEVFGRSDNKFGSCYAEYAVVGANGIAHKPANLAHSEAAAIPLAALTSLQALRDKANIESGDRILIIGACGGVGSYAVQIAKAFGCHVTGTCSAENVERVRKLGADKVIDYTRDPVFETGQPYNVIYDAVAKQSFSAARDSLTHDGIYVATEPTLDTIYRVVSGNWFSTRKTAMVFGHPSRPDLEILAAWATEGKLRSLLDSTFSLNAINEAHLRSETEHAHGKIVINIRDYH